MADPCEGVLLRHEKLPTPGRTVAAVSRAVHGETDDVAGKTVFRHAAYDVGMVVLHRDDPDVFQACASIVVK